MDQKPIDLHNAFGDGVLGRRRFLTQLSLIAAGAVAASSLLPFLESHYALAGIVPDDDPRIQSDYITYPGAIGEIRADLVRPKGNAKVPGVIVIHEIWGLTPYIEDVARRLAVEGFLAPAPDALSTRRRLNNSGKLPGYPSELAGWDLYIQPPRSISMYF